MATEPVTMSERINAPVSTAELERRWALVREAMDEAGVDVLVMQSSSDAVGGYVKYFTDQGASGSGYPITVVFPRDDAMTVAQHGPLDTDRELPAEGDGVLRGVKRVVSHAAFPSAGYTSHYDADNALSALAPYAGGKIGLLGTTQMSFALGKRLEEKLPAAAFVVADELVDPIKAVKSPEEQDLIRACAQVQDAAMAATRSVVKPGMRESDVTAAARRVCEEMGSEAGIYLCGSAAAGTPATIAPRHQQNRVIQEGDVVVLLIECNGPGGQYTELGRTFVLGEVPTQLQEELAFTLEAQRFCVGLMKPGASPAAIWDEYNAYMRDHGRDEENRLHSHGQGYDLVERPLIRHDETMPLAAGMNLACHPTYAKDGYTSWMCDNWLIGPDGPGERLHRFPQEIVALR